MHLEHAASEEKPPPRFSKTVFGGALMGLANLIPGLSGGTMILATGLYSEFIDSVADLSAFRFSRRRCYFLGVLGFFALVSIFAMAEVILYLLFHYSTAMYALFIGMTLGGAPLLYKSVRPIGPGVCVATAGGLALMVAVFMLKQGGGLPHNMVMDVVSGVVGSTAMVLPGISGSYMFLVMDQYDRILGVVEQLKHALADRDGAGFVDACRIAVPVGIGAVAGIVGLSNVLKLLLHRFKRPTIGFLLGLLVGSVFGLWPFGHSPSEDALQRRSAGELLMFAQRRGLSVPEQTHQAALATYILEYWEERKTDDYAPVTVVMVAVMVVGGFMVTSLVARYGEAPGRQSPS